MASELSILALISCLISSAFASSCVASIMTYPGYTGSRTAAGTVTVTAPQADNYTSTLALSYSLTGLEANYAGGLHIHTGTTCEDANYVSGHFYATTTDPWTTTVTTSDGDGASSGSFSVQAGLTFCDTVGHAIVVHDGTDRIGCGICIESCTASITTYPSYTGSHASVAGSVSVAASAALDYKSTLSLYYDLTGLEPLASGGLHIHTGTTCEDSDYVSGHYYATSADPWTTTVETASAAGASFGSFDVAAGLSVPDIVGRAVVMHDGTDRIGCGICTQSTTCAKQSTTCKASLSTYPGYIGIRTEAAGTVTVTGTTDTYLNTLSLDYSLTGLEPNYAGGLHIHGGTTCEDKDYVAGHYYATSADPWTTRVETASAAGASSGNFSVMAGLSVPDIVGRAVVVHDGTDRIGCGVCTPTCTASITTYPGYTGSRTAAGTVTVTGNGEGYLSTLSLDYSLTGLEPSYAGGLHIHTGTTCDDKDYVSGHYYATTTDPWTTTASSDGSGAASGSFSVMAGNGFSSGAVGHAIVVHDGTDRIGCGVCVQDSLVQTSTTAPTMAPTLGSSGDSDDLEIYLIVVIAVGCLLLIGVIIMFAIVGMKKNPKASEVEIAVGQKTAV